MKVNLFLLVLLVSVFSVQAMDLPTYNEIVESLNRLTVDDLQQTLAKIPELVNFADESGKTLLMSVVKQKVDNGKFDVVLKAGADIHAVDKNGMNALHYAAQAGKVDAAVDLVKKGINAKARTHEGDTPLHSLLKKNKNKRAFAITSQAILFSYRCRSGFPQLWCCDYSLLEIENNDKKTPLDIVLDGNNMPTIAIFYQFVTYTTYALAAECTERDFPMLERIRARILSHFHKNEQNVIGRLLDQEFTDVHGWHTERNELLAKLAKKREKVKKLEKVLMLQQP